jgi:hypothetical protein
MGIGKRAPRFRSLPYMAPLNHHSPQMNRCTFLKGFSCSLFFRSSLARSLIADAVFGAALPDETTLIDASRASDWLGRWEQNITSGARDRHCDRELGEELGWLVSPFLNGFYYGYLATRDFKWVERFIDWTDSCVRRSVREPDGFAGWPKGGQGEGAPGTLSDSLLGEAMLLRPVVLMANEILLTPRMEANWGGKARGYLQLAERIFQKWEARGCWREVPAGGVWVVPPFGIDPESHNWTPGYASRETGGFSNPTNKQNYIARWVMALYDVTKNPVYRDRGLKWYQVMKSRLRLQAGGKYLVWNYWDPAGPWDYSPDGSPRHWVGVHPNGAYYSMDVDGMVTAFEHGLVFTREDIGRLIATNRDLMWNQQVSGAKFQRIDGGEPDKRWENNPGCLWTALLPYDEALRKIFLANNDPGSWAGLGTTPWFLARFGLG